MKNFCFCAFLFMFAVLTIQAADTEVRFCLFQSATDGNVDWGKMLPVNIPVTVVLADGTEIPGMTGTLHPPEDARTYDNPSGWGEVCVPESTQSVDLRVTYNGETKTFTGLLARPNQKGGANYLFWDENRIIPDETIGAKLEGGQNISPELAPAPKSDFIPTDEPTGEKQAIEPAPDTESIPA